MATQYLVPGSKDMRVGIKESKNRGWRNLQAGREENFINQERYINTGSQSWDLKSDQWPNPTWSFLCGGWLSV